MIYVYFKEQRAFVVDTWDVVRYLAAAFILGLTIGIGIPIFGLNP